MKRNIAGILVAVVLAGGQSACSSDCVLSDGTPCDAPGASYKLVVTEAPSAAQALVISVDAQGEALTVTLSIGGLMARVEPLNEGRTQWRAVILGPVAPGQLGTVQLDRAVEAEARVTVVEAASGRDGGYAPITPSSIKLELQRIE